MGHALDHLAREILVILGEQDVVEVARHGAVVRAAARQEAVDTPGQLTELFSADFASHEPSPIGAQPLGFVRQAVDQRRGVFHQVHGAVGGSFSQLDHIPQALGGVGDL
ncbi:hypothetical protein D3C76_1579940 [compost metagenome]